MSKSQVTVNLQGQQQLIKKGLRAAIQKEPDFKTAASCYEEAARLGSYQARVLYNNLLLDSRFTNRSRVSKAFTLWLVAATRTEDKERLSVICGHIEPMRKNSFLPDGEQTIAGLLYESKGLMDPNNWYYVGTYFRDGKMGRDLSPEERYEIAANCFKRSSISDALHSLGLLLMEGRVSQVGDQIFDSPAACDQAAAEYFDLVKTPYSFYNIGVLLLRGRINQIGKKTFNSPPERDQKAGECFNLSGIPEALVNLGRLLMEGRIRQVGNQIFNSQPDRDQKAAECFSRVNVSKAFCNLGMLLIEGRISQIGNRRFGSQPKRDQAAAKYLHKARDPEADYNLGKLLMEGRVSQVGDQTFDSQPKRDQKAAECFNRSGMPEALVNLGVLLVEGRISQIGEQTFNSQPERDQKAAECYYKAGTPKGLCNLGMLLMEGRISQIGEQTFNSPPERDQKAAEYFNRSGIPEARANLGVLLVEGRISQVGNQTFDSQPERDQAAIGHFEESRTPLAWYNLGLLYLSHGKHEKAVETFHVLEARGVLTTKDVPQLLSLQLSDKANIHANEKDVKTRELESQASGRIIDDSSLPNKEGGLSSRRLRRAEKEHKKEEDRQQHLLKKFQKWKASQKRASGPVYIRDLLETSYAHADESFPAVKRDIVFLEAAAPARGTPRKELQEWATQRGKNALKALALVEELVSSNLTICRGMPEKLQGKRYPNCWSMRVNNKDRVIYRLGEGVIEILSFEGHYDD